MYRNLQLPPQVWALLGLPYMAFAIPVLGESLHRAKTTAYDQAGRGGGGGR